MEAMHLILQHKDLQSMDAPTDGLEVGEESSGLDPLVEGIRIA